MIFVIDATDIDRLNTASEELSAMLNEEELREAALLVFANKQDQPGARGAGEISEALRLGELKDRNWSIVACSAVDGRGINDGMDWLVVSCSECDLSGVSLLTRTTTANNTVGNIISVIDVFNVLSSSDSGQALSVMPVACTVSCKGCTSGKLGLSVAIV